MEHSLKNRKQNGFTIIEVLIVLAIAALIFLVVFLAVPALQRNQRNNARKTDTNRFSAAVISFISNSNGTLPTVSADVTTIINDVGSTGGYPALTVAPVLATASTNNVALATGIQSAIGTNVLDALRIVTGATCGTGGATVAGNSKQIALQYTLETSSSTVSAPYCQRVQ